MEKKDDSYRLVYSNDGGRICPECRNPSAKCTCRNSKKIPAGDGVARVRREVKARGGKTVTTITGIPVPGDELGEICRKLRKMCAGGGTVKDGVIEIQGDHIETVMKELSRRGFTAKRSGG